MNLAEFRCWRCAHEWQAKPGPQDCPKCGHNYLTWLNYERDFAPRRRDNPMPIILALALTGALAACEITSTFENPNCEAYPYLRVCQEALDCNP